MLTQERLKELLIYNPLTGVFSRLTSTSSRARVGGVAGGVNQDGYIRINIDGKLYMAHRLAFLYMTGKWPEKLVDHIDTIPDHNWWSNLREASQAENVQNLKSAMCNNISGLLGVTYNKRTNRFVARIRLNGVSKYLGTFESGEEAHQTYLSAKRIYHPFNTL